MKPKIYHYETLFCPASTILLQVLFDDSNLNHNSGMFRIFYGLLYFIKGNTLFNFFQLFSCVAFAMSYLSVLLGQFKKKIVFNVLMIALFIETIFLSFNLAF